MNLRNLLLFISLMLAAGVWFGPEDFVFALPSLDDHEARLVIPAADIDTRVTRFYLDGVSWAIPLWEARAGHLEGTSWLDETGNIVIGGHSEYPNGTPGVFTALETLESGDEVMLVSGWQRYSYQVHRILTVEYDDLTVLYPTSHNRLTLITCDEPSYNAETGLYDKRTVVIATRID